MSRLVSASELALSVLTLRDSVTAIQLFAVRDAIRKSGVLVERIDFNKLNGNYAFKAEHGRLFRGEKFSPVEIAKDIRPIISRML